MKISKLFHWLYAFLMFLPIAVFIPNAFYYGFNNEAIAQEKTVQEPVYYQTNTVNNYTDIEQNYVYHWTNNLSGVSPSPSSSEFYLHVTILSGSLKDYSGNFYLNTSGKVYLFADNTAYDLGVRECDFLVNNVLNSISSIRSEVLERITPCDNLYIDTYTPVTTSMSITDSMIYSWESVWSSPLFNWVADSFLVSPFHYIGDLFGLPTNSSFYSCFAYWLNISIIWLCFDVIMYVPLLCHRWIDKGGLE